MISRTSLRRPGGQGRVCWGGSGRRGGGGTSAGHLGGTARGARTRRAAPDETSRHRWGITTRTSRHARGTGCRRGFQTGLSRADRLWAKRPATGAAPPRCVRGVTGRGRLPTQRVLTAVAWSVPVHLSPSVVTLSSGPCDNWTLHPSPQHATVDTGDVVLQYNIYHYTSRDRWVVRRAQHRISPPTTQPRWIPTKHDLAGPRDTISANP